MIAAMVTRIRKGVRPYLYVDEWMAFRDLSDEKIANRLGRDRVTIWRWRKEKRRLTPEKQAELAHALDIEPEQLWRPPTDVSLDAMVKDVPAELKQTALDIVSRLIRRAS
jgi:transcriptional regulator with XRE-family HTH domain